MEAIKQVDDENWGSIDDEDTDEEESEETGGAEDIKGQFVGEGALTAGLSKIMDLGIELARKQRRITIKIVNKSNQDLTNPQWSLRDGITEVNPELTILAKNDTNGEPGTGEAIFRGKTLKGSLSYQIGDKQFAVMILFKVLFFQPEVHLGPAQYDDRNNQVYIKVIPKNELEQRTERKKSPQAEQRTGSVGWKVKSRVKKFLKRKEERLLRQPYLYDKYMKSLQYCTGKYHEYEVDPTEDTDLNGCPKLKFHYSISDIGNAEIRVTVSN